MTATTSSFRPCPLGIRRQLGRRRWLLLEATLHLTLPLCKQLYTLPLCKKQALTHFRSTQYVKPRLKLLEGCLGSLILLPILLPILDTFLKMKTKMTTLFIHGAKHRGKPRVAHVLSSQLLAPFLAQFCEQLLTSCLMH